MTSEISASTNSAAIAPTGDNRLRVYKSVNLWVVNRSFTIDKSRIEGYGVLESIKRVVLEIEGKKGKYVRYYRHYHLLHPMEEFAEILDGARNHRHKFFNNDVGIKGDHVKLTTLAPFIYFDEPDAPYW
ncbi:MAG: hypothetical protein ACYCY5_02190 [Sulfuricella sp.]